MLFHTSLIFLGISINFWSSMLTSASYDGKFFEFETDYGTQDIGKFSFQDDRKLNTMSNITLPELVRKQQKQLSSQLARLKELELENEILTKEKGKIEEEYSAYRSESAISTPFTTARRKSNKFHVQSDIAFSASQLLKPEENYLFTYKYGFSLKTFYQHTDESAVRRKSNLSDELDQRFEELLNRYGEEVFDQIVKKRKKHDPHYKKIAGEIVEKIDELENWDPEVEQMISDISIEEAPDKPKAFQAKVKKSKNKQIISKREFVNLESLKEKTISVSSGCFNEGKELCQAKTRKNDIQKNQRNKAHKKKPVKYDYDSDEYIEYTWKDSRKAFRHNSPNPRRLGFF
ncbi:unnamed protein product [Blepharisma stoltei]|uniref:Uncharacterized protein n=1 Tax=Blepharisma stoltei TaxID=1481888 RepID=A0AAU9KC01_9CILI|nr:unnamed protein product [Blepharisma stoltei]